MLEYETELKKLGFNYNILVQVLNSFGLHKTIILQSNMTKNEIFDLMINEYSLQSLGTESFSLTDLQGQLLVLVKNHELSNSLCFNDAIFFKPETTLYQIYSNSYLSDKTIFSTSDEDITIKKHACLCILLSFLLKFEIKKVLDN